MDLNKILLHSPISWQSTEKKAGTLNLKLFFLPMLSGVLCLFSFIFVICDAKYTVKFQTLNSKFPFLSSLNFDHQHANSIFKWNYNSAVIEGKNESQFSLLVRCQDQQNSNDPYSVTPSKLAIRYVSE